MALKSREKRKRKTQTIILCIGLILGYIGLLCGHFMDSERLSHAGLYILAGTGVLVVLMGWLRRNY